MHEHVETGGKLPVFSFVGLKNLRNFFSPGFDKLRTGTREAESPQRLNCTQFACHFIHSSALYLQMKFRKLVNYVFPAIFACFALTSCVEDENCPSGYYSWTVLEQNTDTTKLRYEPTPETIADYFADDDDCYANGWYLCPYLENAEVMVFDDGTAMITEYKYSTCDITLDSQISWSMKDQRIYFDAVYFNGEPTCSIPLRPRLPRKLAPELAVVRDTAFIRRLVGCTVQQVYDSLHAKNLSPDPPSPVIEGICGLRYGSVFPCNEYQMRIYVDNYRYVDANMMFSDAWDAEGYLKEKVSAIMIRQQRNYLYYTRNLVRGDGSTINYWSNPQGY